MKTWKVLLICCINFIFTFFPQNLVGCASGPDPDDYYPSFFSRTLAISKPYESFYYSPLTGFSEPEEEEAQAIRDSLLINDWSAYTGRKATRTDIAALLYRSDIVDLKAFYGNLSAPNNGTPPAPFKGNSFAAQLALRKNAAALYYIIFSRETAKVSATDDWEVPIPDTMAIDRLVSIADKQYAQLTDPFLKQRYAYQLCKLHYYGKQYASCIRRYEQNFKEPSVVMDGLALSYKAGSLYRLQRYDEAASAFSKLFTVPYLDKNRVYISFNWSADRLKWSGREFAAKPLNRKERANLLGMFAVYGTEYRLDTMKQIFRLDPLSPLLPVIANREINKLEENYLAPLLESKKESSSGQFFSYSNMSPGLQQHKLQLFRTRDFLQTLSRTKTKHAAFYAAGAAYLSYIGKEYGKANELVTYARKKNPDGKIKDQLHMVSLLIMANEGRKLDAALESKLLSSAKWLYKKREKTREYGIFFRNFFTEIIAQRYERQGEKAKAALALGHAMESSGYFVNEFIEERMTSAELVSLYRRINAKNLSPWWNFLVQNNSIRNDHVVDVLGTSYLRDFQFPEAINWLQRAQKLESFVAFQYDRNGHEKQTLIDPFNSYIQESDRFMDPSKTPYNKLRLAKEFLALQKSVSTTKDSAQKAALCLRLANGYYNITYYGNAAEALVYYRPTNEWCKTDYKFNWHRNYYGAYTAQAYFKKAMQYSKDPEVRAKCFFAIARCVQKQKPLDQYDPTDSENWMHFYKSPLFPHYVKEFRHTRFFRYTYDECSYLQDFVKSGK